MTEPKDLRPEVHANQGEEQEVPTDPITQAVSPDPLARPPRPQDRGRERGRRRHPERGRSVERKTGPKPERPSRPAAEVAREIYRSFTIEAYETVYRPDIMTAASGEGEAQTMQDIPYEQWSYTAAVHEVGENVLQIRYERPTGGEGAKGRPRKILGENQSSGDHYTAREAIRELLTERFTADQARLTTLVESYQKTNDTIPQSDAVKKVVVKKERRKGQQVTVSLEDAIAGWQTTLAKKRWEAMMDAVDWFGARVAQVETSIKTITKGGDIPLTQRVEKLDADTTLKTDLAALEEDVKMLETANTTEFKTANDGDQNWVTERLKRQLKRAKSIFERVNRQLETIHRIHEENRIGRQRDLVAETFLTDFSEAKKGTIGRRFIEYAQSQLKEFSPEDELIFWEAINDMCNEVMVRPKEGRPGVKQFDELMRERLNKLNKVLKIYQAVPGGVGFVPSPVEDGIVQLPADGELPVGVAQLVLKAKAEAQLLGELRKRMRTTFALMGKDFQEVVKKSLRGAPTAEKVAMVEELNGQLIDAQKKALKTLNANADFSAKMKGREPRELKWSDKDDKVLSEQLRSQIYQELKLGTPNKIEATRLQELLTSTDGAADAEAAVELAAEARAAKPALDTILSKELDPAVLANLQLQGETANADKVAEAVRQLLQRLANALQSGQLRDAFKQHFDQFVVEGGLTTPNDLKAYLASIQGIVIDCERLQESLGPTWATEVGLITAGTGKKDRQVNVERVRAAFNELSAYGGDFIGALCLEANETARKAILSKVDASALDILNKLAIENEDTAFILLCVLPRLDEETAAVELKTAGIRLANFLKLGNPGERGLKLLEKRGLYVAAGDEAGYQMNTIQTLLQDGQFDHPAA